MFELSERQKEIVNLPSDVKVFLDGSTGCGKTTVGLERARLLLNQNREVAGVLVMTPSRTYARPYEDIVGEEGSTPRILTYNSFIQKSLELFWPWVAESAGFGNPSAPPVFLTIETSQILMSRLVGEKLAAGYFSALSIPRSRIYNQNMMCLHKMAAVGLPFDDYSARMKKSWVGDSTLLTSFDQAQECGEVFRKTCFAHNLLDYAIQVEIFQNELLPRESFRKWLRWNYAHFIFDNVEEDTPAAHCLAKLLLEECRSGLIIEDNYGGFRSFLGGDPLSAETLRECCSQHFSLNDSFVCSPSVLAMSQAVSDPVIPSSELKASPRPAFSFSSHYQYPEMIKQAARDVADLIHRQNIPPSEIVIIAPLVSDVMYTSLERELRLNDVRVYVHRPSRALMEENSSKSLLVLCGLLNSGWGYVPKLLDIVQMLQAFIPSLDPLRGQLLVAKAFNGVTDSIGVVQHYEMLPFADLDPEVQSRVNKLNGRCYERIRQWIMGNSQSAETPDLLLSRFFNEVLVTADFQPDSEMILGVKKVTESMRKFRQLLDKTDQDLIGWPDYFDQVSDGMVSAMYYEDWFSQPQDSVLLSLASAYIMMNRPVKYQIWLNAGSPRWWERTYSQLTNDVIISAEWPEDGIWDAEMVYRYNDENMMRQVLRLIAECRTQVRVYTSELNEGGQDQKSKLLYVFSELSYRFGRDKPLSEAKSAQFFVREDELEGGLYPGIDDDSCGGGE